MEMQREKCKEGPSRPAGDGPLRDPRRHSHQGVQGEPRPITGPSPVPPATGGGPAISSSKGPHSRSHHSWAGRPQAWSRRGPQTPPAPKAEQGLSDPDREAQQPRITRPQGPQRRGGRSPIRPATQSPQATPPPRPAPTGVRSPLSRCATGGTGDFKIQVRFQRRRPDTG
ncbi:hypothetical protein NDU88_006302 [Pleurodeles waltl]|uniref:Uncharacterized protein n=1 Tax=Pleurodeles waltl TaxID=8319 RepID=A0AAV7NPX9_PLEWA|nr:hypothetical protein NDU88_006302 [Pleurodeles waltl]